MATYQLRRRVISRIKKFELTEKDVDYLIHLGDFRYSPDRDPCCGEPFGSIKRTVEGYSEHKRHDLMCLMFLGRNIAYIGFNEEAVDDFCFHADEWGKKVWHGSTDPEYIAGKVPLSKWLRLVKENVHPDFWSCSEQTACSPAATE